MDRTPRRKAEQLLKEWGIDTLPISPKDIAYKQNILCQEMPSREKGVSGMLLKVNDNYGILYSTYHDNEGFENFSIAHELGHYFLSEHPEAIFTDGDMHHSRAGYRSDDRYEIEADQFASGLLMPDFLFKSALDRAGTGLSAIKSLANLCSSSLTATAINYARKTTEPAAIVVTIGSKIDYCFMSDELMEYPGLSWLKKGAHIPQNTKTLEFNAEEMNVVACREDESDCDLNTWFQSDLEVEVFEEIVGLGSYGKTLTVLTLPDPPDLGELEEDEELEESWTPRFRRR